MAQQKDLLRAISNFDKSPEALRDAFAIIDEFLEQHQNPSASKETSEDRLSTQLLDVFKGMTPPIIITSLSDSRLSDFCNILQRLLPVLSKRQFFDDWWEEMLYPSLSVIQELSALETVKEITCQVLQCAGDSHCIRTVMQCTLKLIRNTLFLDNNDDNVTHKYKYNIDVFNTGPLKNLLDCCFSYGNLATKSFFNELETFFKDPYFVISSSFFLLLYLQRLPLHAHQIVNTSLLPTLLTTLQESKHILFLSSALSSIIILLPRICTSLSEKCLDLFHIFARLLLWEEMKEVGGISVDKDKIVSIPQDPATSLSPLVAENEVQLDYYYNLQPYIEIFFTHLYGLFPVTFLEFLTKLKKGKTEFGEVDEILWKSRLLPLLLGHSIHPGLVCRNSDTELHDAESRWMRMEPNDIVAECIELKVHSDDDEYRKRHLEVAKQLLLDTDTYHGHLTAGISIDRFVNNYQSLFRSTSFGFASTSDMVAKTPSNLSIDCSASIGGNEASLPSLMPTINIEESPTEKRKPHSIDLPNMVNLMRAQLLLEHYITYQHVEAAKQCKRQLVAKEAHMIERSNLVEKYKSLSQHLSNLKQRENDSIQKMMALKERHIKWEKELSSKLKSSREEKRKALDEVLQLRALLDERENEYHALETKQKECLSQLTEAQAKIKSLSKEVTNLNETEQKVNHLTKQLLLWQVDRNCLDIQTERLQSTLRQLVSANVISEGNKQELRRLKDLTKEQEETIDDLSMQVERLKKVVADKDIAQKDQWIKLNEQLNMVQTSSSQSQRECKQLRETNTQLQGKVIELHSELERLRLKEKSLQHVEGSGEFFFGGRKD